MALEINDQRAIHYINTQLILKNIYIPPMAHETKLEDYQKRVRRELISQNHREADIDTFLKSTMSTFISTEPSTTETRWFEKDQRASFWLMCNYNFASQEELNGSYQPPINPILSSMTAFTYTNIPPDHKLRLNHIEEKFDRWSYNQTLKQYVNRCHKEWADLMSHHDIFSDIDSKSDKDLSWLKTYLDLKKISLQGYSCGTSNDEVMAYCYASYFTWKKYIAANADSNAIFVKDFKRARSMQKTRLKKKEANLRPLSVSLRPETHEQLRYIATTEGISNDTVIEYAINLAFNTKKGNR